MSGLVIFDNDGVLVDSERLANTILAELLTEAGLPYSFEEAVRDFMGGSMTSMRQKAEARKSWAGSGEAATEVVWFGVREKTGATEFLGYATTHAEGVVNALVVDGKPVQRAEPGPVMLVTNQTADTTTATGERPAVWP